MPDARAMPQDSLSPEEVQFKGFIDPLLAEMVVRTGLDMTYVNIWHATGIQESRYVCNVGGFPLKPGDTMDQKHSICIRCREAGILWTSDVQGDLPGTILDGSDLNTYLSIPLYASDGNPMGTLCGLGRAPREMSQPVLSYVQSLGRAIAAFLDRPGTLPGTLQTDGESGASNATAVATGDIVGTLLDALPDAVILLQVGETGCSIVSASGRPLHGSPASLAGQEAHAVLDHNVASVFHRSASDALRRGRTLNVTYNAPVEGKGQWLRLSAHVTPMADSRVLWVARDVSEQHTMEVALREAVAMNAAAARAKGDFLTAMSHELRTPLNAIIGFASVLGANRGDRLNGADVKYVDRIRTNGLTLLGMVEHVLEFASADAGMTECTFAPTDLGALVEGVMGEFRTQSVREGVDVATDLGTEPVPLVLTDEVKLRNVLSHLVGNAAKYTSIGRITAVISLAPGTDTPVRLDISDTGPGIPVDRLAAIMTPFEQGTAGTTRTDAGLGLGLATARTLCQQMGLKLSVASEVGRGTTFSICFSPQAVQG
jgi:signal transduction histidine kinase